MEGNKNNSVDLKYDPEAALSSDSDSSGDGLLNFVNLQWNHSCQDQQHDEKQYSPDRGSNSNAIFDSKSETSLEENVERYGNEYQPQQSAPGTPFRSQNRTQTPHHESASTYPPYGIDACVYSNQITPPQVSTTYNLLADLNKQGMDRLGLSLKSTSTGMPMVPEMIVKVDSSTVGMLGMGNFRQYRMNKQDTGTTIQPKQIIQLSQCVLYPANHNVPPPVAQAKPLGCKTVCVSGLPQNITEEIIKEVFELCGIIERIHMNKYTRNFCHIRFTSETFVENAIYFSTYQIKIQNRDEAGYCGMLFVDYARSKDDEYDYECKQRALSREARHSAKYEKKHRVKTPHIPPYHDSAATTLSNKLRGEDTFQQATVILITWLEGGECNRRNAGFFFSMIQSTNSHLHKLMNDKLKYEDEFEKEKVMLKEKMQSVKLKYENDFGKLKVTLQENRRRILLRFNAIDKIFHATCVQKVWDHFTKTQRKQIEKYKKEFEENKKACTEKILNDRIEDEMETSDNEDSEKTQEHSTDNQTVLLQEEVTMLKVENASVRCQLKTAENEIRILRLEAEAMRQTIARLQNGVY